MSMTTTSASVTRDRLRAGSDLVEVSLMASRARSAAVRARGGAELDDFDRSALEALRIYLEDVANSIQFFASGGTAGVPPHGSFTAKVDATLDAAINRPGADTAQTLTERLRILSEASQNLEHDADQAAPLLVDFLAQLSSSALRQGAHTGETTSTF